MTENGKTTEKTNDRDAEAGEVVEKKEVRALHKTTSIFLRNLAPSITKAEVEAVSCFYSVMSAFFKAWLCERGTEEVRGITSLISV